MSTTCQRAKGQWPLTPLLAVALCLCFGSGNLLAQAESGLAGELLSMGAKVDDWVNKGELWRLVVSGWLHADAQHLLVNVLWLVVLGRILRAHVGGVGVFTTWTLGAMAGQTLSYLLEMGASVGASGGVAALLAHSLGLLFAQWTHLINRVRLGLVLGTLASVAMLFFTAHSTNQVDHAAHLGGVLLGLSQLIFMKRPTLMAYLAVTLTLLGGMSAALSPTISPVDDSVHSADVIGFQLPQVGVRGHFEAGRCQELNENGATITSETRIQCVAQDWRMLTLIGPVELLVAVDPVLARHMPKPGRCRQLQHDGETLLLARSTAGQALAFATLSPVWERYDALRTAIVNGQCRDR